MCSVFENAIPKIEEISLEGDKNCYSKCRKCTTENASVILQKRFSYCRSCFLQVVTHKFRSTLGKLKLKQMKDRVLVIFSGAHSSVMLLHLLHTGMGEENHKKLRFHMEVLFIDDSVLWPENWDRSSTISEILVLLNKFPFKYHIIKLSSIYKKAAVENFEVSRLASEEVNDEYDEKLKQLFDGVGSSTSKMDFLFQLRRRVTYECAVVLKCNKIFTSECATDVAVQLMSDIVLERSSQIAFDTSTCDTRHADVDCIRPLREITSKEVSFYNVFNKLDFLLVPSPATMFNYKTSIQWETLSFMCKLQEEFPSTIYTVFNLGDKLQKIDDAAKISCSLCRLPLEDEASHVLQEKLPKKVGNDGTSKFCRGCAHVIADTDTLDNLPKL